MKAFEINIRLAEAIGYEKENIRRAQDCARVVEVNRPTIYGESWYRFDFDSPAVIWPIAERFDCFPVQSGKEWAAVFKKDRHPVVRRAVFADTAAKAVALAVIKALKGAKE